MASNSPGPSGNAASSPDFSALPRGLLGRKGLPLARGARLPSIRSPRDLTLGGAAKRTFTPNLNVRRDKNKEIEANSSPAAKDALGGKKGPRTRGSDRGRGGRGRGRGRGELIQLQGSVFGEGLAAGTLKKGAFGRTERDSSNHIPVPKLKLSSTNRTKEEKLQDEEKLHELLRDDFVDDLDGNDAKMAPIHLPLLGCDVKLVKDDKGCLKIETLENDEILKIKKDPDAMDVDEPDEAKVKTEVKSATRKKDISACDLFSDSSLPESGTLLLFQFPDILPGIAASNEDMKSDPRKKASTSSSQATTDDTETKTGRVLSDFPEGYIGKLQVLKSGKTRLMLGSVAFAIDTGTPLGFLQDLISIKAKDDTTSEMIVLGHVQQKLVCMPDMEALLQTAKETT